MHYELLDLKNILRWNKILKNFENKFLDIYFRPEYHSLYEDNGDGKAYCFYYSSSYGEVLYPFLKNSINSLGYKLDQNYYDIQSVYGYSGCIYSNDSQSLKKKFYEIFSTFCKKSNIIAEFIRFHPILNNQNFSVSYLDVIKNRKTVVLNLNQTYKNIFENEYSSNNRRKIKKAQKILNYNISMNANKLEIFKKNYIDTMKRINSKKYYYFSEEYFLGFLNKLKKYSYVINVYDKKNIVQNSMIVFIDGIYAHYHLGGRSNECKINFSSNYMLDIAIKLAIEKGCKFFHFGGGSTTSESDSLLRFKSHFSKTKLDLYIGCKLYNEEIYNKICLDWKNKNRYVKNYFQNFFLKYRVLDNNE